MGARLDQVPAPILAPFALVEAHLERIAGEVVPALEKMRRGQIL